VTLLDYILVALATYRVATDVAWEDGPFELFAWLRGQALQRFGPDSWVANGIGCPICVAFWLAPLALAAWAYVPWLVIWLAVAGAVALMVRSK